MKRLIFTICLGFFFFTAWCQENNHSEASAPEGEAFHSHHNIGLMITHVHIRDGRDINGDKKVILAPGFSFDYNFIFSPKWSVGLHTDLTMEKYVVEKHLESGDDKETIERSFPLAPAAMVAFKPGKHFSFSFGAGVELEKEESLFLNRVGVEYSLEIRKHWEFLAALQYDMRWNAYDTWVFGAGIAYVFGE